MEYQTINMGDTLTCAETGKQFIASRDGCSVNFARDNQGNIFSDEGVDIRERKELLDRSKAFYCYVSGDSKRVTGWKGNTLGTIVRATKGRGGFGDSMLYVKVRDVHGAYWYGKNAGASMCIKLRPCKGA